MHAMPGGNGAFCGGGDTADETEETWKAALPYLADLRRKTVTMVVVVAVMILVVP